ncbi:hypothetical protein HUN41_00041 [Streptomyces phage Coruscant]|uniref:Uncharacterized protein n=1 Tax=Streptomyces phage Coruscant TaxID=2739834 RepID=A0A7G4AVY0_9CAUD|nr:hypothetical protein PP454_gp247 [Streptomyces phage Coruscant]QMP84170.1 hypothetical protein HUN41_00041 [Streptomyces phage Coruscant]
MTHERFWAESQLEEFCGTKDCCVDEYTGRRAIFGGYNFIILNKVEDGYRGVFDFDTEFWVTLPEAKVELTEA